MTFSQWLEDVRELVESKRLQPTHLKDLIAILNDYGSPIFVACIYGISSILHKVQGEASCIGRTVNYNAKNAQGASALYLSTRNGRTNSLRFLLDHGASIDQSGGFFGNPLQAAAFHGHEDIVRILIEYKADLFAPGKFTGALDAALAGGNGQVIEPLLEASNISDTADLERVLLRASYDGHYGIVCRLLEQLTTGDGKHSDGTSKLYIQRIVLHFILTIHLANTRLHDTLQLALFQGRARIAKRMLKKSLQYQHIYRPLRQCTSSSGIRWAGHNGYDGFGVWSRFQFPGSLRNSSTGCCVARS